MAHSAEPLAPRDLHILAALAKGEAHGYALITGVEQQSGGKVLLDPANLYRVLRRMRRDGWIREVAGSEEEERRRVYEITPRGRALLRSEVDRLDHLLRQVKPALADGGSRRRT